jgi:hypothetical protein
MDDVMILTNHSAYDSDGASNLFGNAGTASVFPPCSGIKKERYMSYLKDQFGSFWHSQDSL